MVGHFVINNIAAAFRMKENMEGVWMPRAIKQISSSQHFRGPHYAGNIMLLTLRRPVLPQSYDTFILTTWGRHKPFILQPFCISSLASTPPSNMPMSSWSLIRFIRYYLVRPCTTFCRTRQILKLQTPCFDRCRPVIIVPLNGKLIAASHESNFNLSPTRACILRKEDINYSKARCCFDSLWNGRNQWFAIEWLVRRDFMPPIRISSNR